MLGTHNSTDELNSLVGLTIKGWKEVEIDWGHSFVMLETNQKFDSGETVYLLLSNDAEGNEGGCLSFVDSNFEKEIKGA
jgi:hypothetical protein